jgi:hypothetical protein
MISHEYFALGTYFIGISNILESLMQAPSTASKYASQLALVELCLVPHWVSLALSHPDDPLAPLISKTTLVTSSGLHRDFLLNSLP